MLPDINQYTMENPLLFAFLVHPRESVVRTLSIEEIPSEMPEHAFVWVHFNYRSSGARHLLSGLGNIEEPVIDALLSNETRPRAAFTEEEIFLSLRGVNLIEGEDPEDMVSLRMVFRPNWLVSCQRRDLKSVIEISEQLKSGQGFKNVTDLFLKLVERMTFRIGDVIDKLEDRAFELEERILDGGGNGEKTAIHDLRRSIIQYKRYLQPQRDALLKLHAERVSWINQKQYLRLREINDQLARYIEMLDASRDLAAVSMETLNNRHSEQISKRMYMLSIVAALFLPLSFFTGLFGVNLRGIPQSENPHAFQFLILFLVVVILVQLILFWRKKWL